ncbi:TIGR02281 family clan AA aspartic protease [Novosphingobium sp. 9]|uniref:retropepsin-like aspartic protease family protein n=1 Tax=Novosphingobium sp. 9 TaxID=2025349 RepID=UPI0021B57AFD|nr:TIGR02281 family clan AA aspartic protease [Novosphingobium sp. 9]
MRIAPILVLVASLGVIVWLAPGLKGGASAPEALSSASPTSDLATTQPPAQAAAGWGGDGTTLTRAPDGHFYADATLNGQPVHMLVDTGASVVALTGDDARGLGLSWSDSDVRAIGKGASGTVYGVPVTLDRVELGTASARGIGAVIVPEGLPVSLLGQSALEKLGNVHIDGDRMELGGS